MKCFKYVIYKDSKIVFQNFINAESKEKAIAELEEVKKEYNGTHIKINETAPLSNQNC